MSIESKAQAAAYDFRSIRERLLAADPSLANDPDCLLDTLEGIANLHECITEMLWSALMAEEYAEATANKLTDLKNRKAAFLRRAQTLRAGALTIMADHDIRKIERPELTASITRTAPAPIIINENLIPDRLMRIERKPNLTAIKKELVNGADVPGAELSNGGETLTIRMASTTATEDSE